MPNYRTTQPIGFRSMMAGYGDLGIPRFGGRRFGPVRFGHRFRGGPTGVSRMSFSPSAFAPSSVSRAIAPPGMISAFRGRRRRRFGRRFQQQQQQQQQQQGQGADPQRLLARFQRLLSRAQQRGFRHWRVRGRRGRMISRISRRPHRPTRLGRKIAQVGRRLRRMGYGSQAKQMRLQIFGQAQPGGRRGGGMMQQGGQQFSQGYSAMGLGQTTTAAIL